VLCLGRFFDGIVVSSSTSLRLLALFMNSSDELLDDSQLGDCTTVEGDTKIMDWWAIAIAQPAQPAQTPRCSSFTSINSRNFCL